MPIIILLRNNPLTYNGLETKGPCNLSFIMSQTLPNGKPQSPNEACSAPLLPNQEEEVKNT